jgi:hypothetical protein
MTGSGQARRRSVAAVLGVALAAVVMSACAPPPEDPPPPAPPDEQSHVTVWGTDVAYSNSAPELVDFVLYGTSFYHLHNHPQYGGCTLVDGADDGSTRSVIRIDASTLRVRLTVKWTEARNEGTGDFECGLNDPLFGDLVSAGGDRIVPFAADLISHT